MTQQALPPDVDDTPSLKKVNGEEPKDIQINDIVAIKYYIKQNHPGPENSIIDVKYLWDDFYRVNYRKEIRSDGSFLSRHTIIHSVFIKISKVTDGYFGEIIPEPNTKSNLLKDV